MSISGFREKVMSGAPLAGTFMKTPAYEVVEILAQSDLDFICLDAEHSPFDRGRLDACLAVARALDFPTLVRVEAGTPQAALQALDSGAVGLVVPHVDTVEKAKDVARSGRFGHGGRGFAGSTRWAGFATRPMASLLEQSKSETLIFAQIEEPEGVEAAAAIAGVDGIDGLFVGPADLSVAYGKTDTLSQELQNAFRAVGEATKAAGKAYMTFVADAAAAKDLQQYGLTMFFIASEQGWMRQRASEEAQTIHKLG